MNTTTPDAWNMVGIETVNTEAVANALSQGWEPFAIHVEPTMNPLNPREIRMKTVVWLKQKGLLTEDGIDPSKKTEKSTESKSGLSLVSH